MHSNDLLEPRDQSNIISSSIFSPYDFKPELRSTVKDRSSERMLSLVWALTREEAADEMRGDLKKGGEGHMTAIKHLSIKTAVMMEMEDQCFFVKNRGNNLGPKQPLVPFLFLIQ